MEISIMSYKNMNDMNAQIDGNEFKNIKTLSDYIIKKKFNVQLVRGTLCNELITIANNKGMYMIKIGSNSHNPDNVTYFKNVIVSHIKKLEKEIEIINNTPIIKFEV